MKTTWEGKVEQKLCIFLTTGLFQMFYEKHIYPKITHISLSISLLLKRYIRKYLGWLQGETRKLHKIFENKNLTESVHKYLEITQEGFAYHEKFRMVCEIPSWLHLGFAWCTKFLHGCILVSHGVWNFTQGAKFLSLIPALCPAAIEAPLDFA